MFYTVSLGKETGIASVSGAGRYCFGTTVTITATPESGYKFSHWTGNSTSTSQTLSFVIYDSDVSYTANAKREDITVHFYKGTETGNTASETRKYEHGKNGQTFPDFGWKKNGYHQVGWSKTKNASAAQYTVTNEIQQAWIDQNMPSVNLYAVWSMNDYSITFQANGGTGNIANISTKYNEKVTLPKDGFLKEASSVCGWSTNADATEPDYPYGVEVDVQQIVDLAGLQNTHNGTIVLYAVWDNAPVIEGEHIYVSLEDAISGVVTEEYLAQYVIAQDEEDGIISFGVHATNSLQMNDYKSTDFTSFLKEGSVTETFVATDSSGNTTRKLITVHIVDTSIYDSELLTGNFRFLSSKYFIDSTGNFIPPYAGGLPESSIWRTNPDYSSLLSQLYTTTE